MDQFIDMQTFKHGIGSINYKTPVFNWNVKMLVNLSYNTMTVEHISKYKLVNKRIKRIKNIYYFKVFIILTNGEQK